jgi:ATP-dependent DNA helicase RecG
LIQAFLQEVKSDLYEESKHISLNDLARQMHIAKGPDEDLRPVNVGLLFFSRQPDLFFPRSWIELVWHKGDTDDSFTEVYFKGPIHVQLRAALAFISNNIIAEKVRKINGKAEADRYYNFPFKAVEEALSNAVYHKSYELGAPIEVQIWPDKIEILSFPGPVPPVEVQILKQQKRIVARDYRNRRIGDFLKEIHLTEGRGTGFPAIYKAMANNNSPEPIFETNEQCTHFLTTLFVNSFFATLEDEIGEVETDEFVVGADKIGLKFNSFNDILSYCDQVRTLNNNNISDFANTSDQDSDQASDQAKNQKSNQESNQDKNLIDNKLSDSKNLTNQDTNQVTNQAKAILNSTIHNRVSEILMLTLKPQKRDEILHSMKLSNQSANRKKYINPLIEYGWLEMLYPDKKSSPKQMYTTTEKGKILLKLIANKIT